MTGLVLPCLQRRADGGITLIEMLIVLAIIGVATGAATLGLGALAQDDAAESEARKLAFALAEGLDIALITGVAQPVRHTVQGYQIGGGPAHVLGAGVALIEGAGSGGVTLLSDDQAGAPAVFTLQGDGPAWRVTVAGFAVAVNAVAVP